MRGQVGISVLCAMLMGLTATALADGAPSLLNNQGVLLTPGGGPVPDGTYSLTFSLYAAVDAPAPVWSELIDGVAVENGFYTVALGSGAVALPPSLFRDNPSIWFGVRVDDEAELPRRRLLSVPFAIEATHAATATTAGALSCSGCVDEEALSFDVCSLASGCAFDGAFAPAPHTHAGSDVTSAVAKATLADAATVAQGLACTGCVTSAQVAFAYAGASAKGGPATSARDSEKLGGKLPDAYAEASHAHSGADITSPVAEATYAANSDALSGKTAAQIEADLLAAVAAEGYLSKSDKIGQDQLPPNGLDEVSNGLFSNQFVDSVGSLNTPVDIPDNSPPGVTDEIVFPDIGVAEKLTVSVDISNTNVANVIVTLTDPLGATFLLYNGGSSGPKLATSYPDPTLPVTGDLTAWVGKNPQGSWTLKVVDTVHLNNGVDGQINSWSINLQTLSTKKIALKGDLVADGAVTLPGDLSVGGQLSCAGCVGKAALEVSSQQALVPAGAVMFFNLAACPAGWSELTAGRGRYLVGLPSGGTLGAAVGTPLANQEDRPVGKHTHGVNDPGHNHYSWMDSDSGPDGGTGSAASEDTEDIQLGTSTSATGITLQATGTVDGTNAPFLQLLVCQKL